ncbi:efflux RND transporter periplasmic adaptor subunit [Alteromonas sp. H39]|uniref:efflux RND transporter periplasmic adaptor subunit n=1 Tax=Alteromonas sp. H39 TaxID=3389876 RepID=UPI0039DFE8F4
MKTRMPKACRWLGCLMLLSVSAIAQDTTPPALVEIDTLRHETITQQVWVPGTVVSRTDAQIASEVAGRIMWMAEVGQHISRGEVLVKLDATRLTLQLKQDEANVAMWESRVALLERKRERFSRMAKQQNVSEDQLDETLSELEVARQELAQAKVSHSLTNYQIERSTVRAPFDAIIVSRLQVPGEYTSVGQSLLQVVDPTNVEATVRAPLSVIPFIEQGMSVAVSDRRQTSEEVIRTVVPVGNAASRMMEIRISLMPNQFAIGSAVRVALPHSKAHRGMTVPRDALVLRKAGAFIYQINADNEATQVAVTTGVGVGDRIEVFGELEAGSPVVVRGAERLRSGQKVRYVDDNQSLTARTP